MKFFNYDVPFTTSPKLWNNGHSAEIQIPPNTAYCTCTGLSGRYNLNATHFHWGSSSSVGSEHVVDGERLAAEVHLVHYNSKYGNLDEAAKHKDGLLVLGILLQVSVSSLT